MNSDPTDPTAPSAAAPPDFASASNLRQKANAAGLDPAYWYAVEWTAAVARGQVVEVVFQGTSVAVFRGADGKLGAMENRCAHRQVPLSSGRVQDCRLTCRYHGWAYEADGKLAHIPHETFGKPVPSVTLRSYPVQEKYGLIWVFFGDTSLMNARPLPEIPELEGPAPWVSVPIDYVWKSNVTAIVNNVMDSTHVAALHTKFHTRSFIYGPVTRCEAVGDTVVVTHDLRPDPGSLLRHIAKPLAVPHQEMVYLYPYLRVGVGGVFRLWNFLLPIDDKTTRIFMLSCSEQMKVPFTSLPLPNWLARLGAQVAKPLLVRPLFDEDGWSTEAEFAGYQKYFARPVVDPHPAPRLCYQLTVRKWEEALRREARAGSERGEAGVARERRLPTVES